MTKKTRKPKRIPAFAINPAASTNPNAPLFIPINGIADILNPKEKVKKKTPKKKKDPKIKFDPNLGYFG